MIGCIIRCIYTFLFQIVLCENSIYSQACMNDTLTHELIHAYDYCRAHVELDNIKHLACTEVSTVGTVTKGFTVIDKSSQP